MLGIGPREVAIGCVVLLILAVIPRDGVVAGHEGAPHDGQLPVLAVVDLPATWEEGPEDGFGGVGLPKRLLLDLQRLLLKAGKWLLRAGGDAVARREERRHILDSWHEGLLAPRRGMGQDQ